MKQLLNNASRSGAGRFLAVFMVAAFMAAPVFAQRNPPRWAMDVHSVFPSDTWLAFVESDPDAQIARNNALADLATVFKTDVQSLSNSYQEYNRVVLQAQGKKSVNFSALSKAAGTANSVTATSNVTGLIGVQIDKWQNPRDKSWYVVVRMNRPECSARYASMVRENTRVIQSLENRAANAPGTFDAVEFLTFAVNLAKVTDNFQNILSVLDTRYVGKRAGYGGEQAVRALQKVAAQAVTVSVSVEGDKNQRLEKAFKGVFDKKGFRTLDENSESSYNLSADFETEDAGLDNPRYADVSWTLTVSMKNADGDEIISFDKNDRARMPRGRDGSNKRAVKKAMDNAEKLVKTGEFAKRFDDYLASLLN
jgi:hypothetical protein